MWLAIPFSASGLTKCRRLQAVSLSAAKRSYLASEVSGCWEELPRVRGHGQQLGGATQGVVAAQAQEGLEELFHVECQEQWQ